MKRVILAAVSTVAGLTALLSFKTRPTPALAAGRSTANPATGAGSNSPANARASHGTTNTTPATTPAGANGTKTIDGATADTRFGPVQVEITVANGKVTGVHAVEYPTERRRDVQINDYAIPILDQEAVAAKTANIDMVSGATYTSTGYIKSLQSALDKAALG